jgi:hypothetical protein
MFKKYWKYVGIGELKSHVIEDNLAAWEKVHSITKAETFQKEELFQFYEETIRATCAENLLLATYVIIGKR